MSPSGPSPTERIEKFGELPLGEEVVVRGVSKQELNGAKGVVGKKVLTLDSTSCVINCVAGYTMD